MHLLAAPAFQADSIPLNHQGSLSPFVKEKVKVKSLRRVRLLATPLTVAYQVPPSMGFSRQEDWSGLPFPSPVLNVKASTMNLHRVLTSLHEEPCIEKMICQKGSFFF